MRERQLLHMNQKMAQKVRECSDQVDMRGWHIGHEEEAQGPDDPTNKISLSAIGGRLA